MGEHYAKKFYQNVTHWYRIETAGCSLKTIKR